MFCFWLPVQKSSANTSFYYFNQIIDIFYSLNTTPTGKPVHGVTFATWVYLEDIKNPTHQLFTTIDPGWTNPRSKTIYDFGITKNGAIHFSHRNVFGRRTTPVVKPKVWTHLVASYDVFTDKVRMFVNGKEHTSFRRTDLRRTTTLSQDWREEATIGKFRYTAARTRYLRGRLDEYYIYPCALGPGQAERLMNKKCEESK